MATESETIVKVKLWGVFALIVAAISYLFIIYTGMEKRVTVVETSIPYISQNLTEMKSLVQDIRREQIRQYGDRN